MNGGSAGYAPNGGIEFDELTEESECFNVSAFDAIFNEQKTIKNFKLQITSRGKMRALLQKNFLRMWRNVGVMLFIFALPVMQVILFCLAIGRDPTGLKLAVANMEMNDTVVSNSRQFGLLFDLKPV